MRLSAVAMMPSSVERGVQPRRRWAFALVEFLTLPSSGTRSLISGMKRAAKRTSQSGSSRVGTRLAAAPK